MQNNLDDQAIKAALDGNWETALQLNQAILENHPQSIPALNRLAKAYAQLGQTEQAMATYEQVLGIDKYNSIAQKQCVMLKQGSCKANSAPIMYTEFIEQPGRTKTCTLVRLGDSKVILALQPGQIVNMVVKNHWIAITNHHGEHIGALADNISFKLKQYIAGGNEYQAIVRTVSGSEVSVFIREVKRAAAFANTPSF